MNHLHYKIVSIEKYQTAPGLEPPKEPLFKVTFWHLDRVHQGTMITGLPTEYSEEWLQQRIEEFIKTPLVRPGPSETKDAINRT